MIQIKDGHLVFTASSELAIKYLLNYFKLTHADLEEWIRLKSPLYKRKGKKAD